MFTKNLRFFEQTLHPQWPIQISKMGKKWTLSMRGEPSNAANATLWLMNDNGQVWSLDTKVR